MDGKMDLSATRRCHCLAARREARAITRLYEEKLRPHGLRATQFSVLAALHLKGPTPVGELADVLGLERTSLTRSAAVLERNGWIGEAESEDARERPLELLETGLRKLEAAFPAWKEVQELVNDRRGKEARMTRTSQAIAPMSQALISEVVQEAEATRRVLERVPEDRLAWRPHPKSMSLGQLALHVAMIPGALAEFVSEPVREVPTFVPPQASSRGEILAAFEDSVRAARTRLESWSDEDLNAEWAMTRAGKTVLALPRIGMLRSIMLNHWYHHRGQLVVYLRLLDVPLPPVYGPSADESPFT